MGAIAAIAVTLSLNAPANRPWSDLASLVARDVSLGMICRE